MSHRLACAAALLALTAACGGDDGGSTALEGIYQQTRTHNPDGCDGEGPPQLVDSNIFVRQDSFLGAEFISVVACDPIEDCRMRAADTDTIYLGEFSFDSGSDEEGWTGRSLGLSVGDTCSGSVFEARLTGEPQSSVRIEQEIKSVSGVPLDDMGECDEDAAYQQAEAAPCEELTVVKGAYLEGI